MDIPGKSNVVSLAARRSNPLGQSDRQLQICASLRNARAARKSPRVGPTLDFGVRDPLRAVKSSGELLTTHQPLPRDRSLVTIPSE